MTLTTRDNTPKPRVLVVTPQPYYEDRGTPIAISMVLQALAELGYEIDLLAFPLGANLKSPGLRILRSANPTGISSVPVGFSWRKVLLDGFLAASLRRWVAREDYKCIHAVEEAAYLATFLPTQNRPPVIYDMASVLPEELSRLPLFQLPGLLQLARHIEQSVLRRVDHVVCSRGLGSYVIERASRTPVTEWLFPTSAKCPEPGARGRVRKELRIADNALACIYTGNFAAYQGLEVITEAISTVRAQVPTAVFVLVGAVPEDQEYVRNLLSKHATGGLHVVPRQPRDRVADYLAAADVLLCPRADSRNTPLKIFEYLATGKPVLASEGEAHQAVADYPQVQLFPHSTEGFARTLLKTLTGEPAKQLASPLAADDGWAAFRDQIEAIYSRLLTE